MRTIARVFYRGFDGAKLFPFHVPVEKEGGWHESVKRSVSDLGKGVALPEELSRWFSTDRHWNEFIRAVEEYAKSEEFATEAILPAIHEDPMLSPRYRWNEDREIWRLEAQNDNVAILSDATGMLMCVTREYLDTDFERVG